MRFTRLISIAAALSAVSASPVPWRDDSDHGHNHGHSNGHHRHGSSTPANQLYQYSVIAALTVGVAANGTQLSTVLTHGDLGLGTFPSLQGEMIIVDGVAYRGTAAGVVELPDPERTQTPFAAITKFEPDVSVRAAIANFSDFTAQLPSWFPAPVAHHFMSYRLDGTFTLRIRAPAGQEYPGEPLANVTARQTEFSYENIEGTMVGFRTPKYAANVNAAGDHLHFISADRKRGGHVLEFKTVGEASVKLAKMDTYTVTIPPDGQFDEVSLA